MPYVRVEFFHVLRESFLSLFTCSYAMKGEKGGFSETCNRLLHYSASRLD